MHYLLHIRGQGLLHESIVDHASCIHLLVRFNL
jgi:hypothetical protein